MILRKEIVRSAKQFVRFGGVREKFCDEISKFLSRVETYFENIRISECLTSGIVTASKMCSLVYSNHYSILLAVNWNEIVVNGEIGIKLSVLGTMECLEWKIGHVCVKIGKLIKYFIVR